MGNEIFVSQNSKVFKDTTTYQKHFGGDGVYILMSGKQSDLLSQKNLKKITILSNDLKQVKNVRGTMNIVSVMNEQLKNAANGSATSSFNISGDGQNEIMANLTSGQQAKIQTTLENLLNTEQKSKIQNYSINLLSASQKSEMAGKIATGQNAQLATTAVMTTAQTKQIQNYSSSLLTTQQQAILQKEVIKALPAVQNMNSKLLHNLLFSNNGKLPTQLNQLLPQNGKHLLFVVNTSDKTDMSVYVQLSKDINGLINKENFYHRIKIRVAGLPVVQGQVQNEVFKTMGTMLGLAVVIMIVILYLIFPVRRRLLSLLFVVVSLIWTFGIMGLLGIPLTLATMATLPIIIGLGTDFGVQFHNRYEEEYRRENDSQIAADIAISNMGPAVGIALIVMSLSFLTMFLAKAPMMQQFGLTLAIGVVASYIVEIVLMFATLTLLDHKNPTKTIKATQDSKLSVLLGKYAGFVIHHAKAVLAVGLIAMGIGFSLEPKVGVQTDLLKMIPQNMSTLKNTKYLQTKAGSTTYLTYLVKSNKKLDVQDIQTIKRIGASENEKYSGIVGVTSVATLLEQNNVHIQGLSALGVSSSIKNLPSAARQTTISSNKKFATIQFKVKNKLVAKKQLVLLNKINRDIKKTSHNGLKISPAGAQVMMLNGTVNMTANHDLIMFAGLAIIFIVLALVYRDLKLAMMPVIPILIVLGLSPLSLYLMNIPYNPVTIALSSLVLGIGTEFTILILERYKEERDQGIESKQAIISSVSSVGQAITVSGLTVMGGFAAIIFASFPVLQTFGLITVLDTGFSLISALTVLPAVIYLFDKNTRRKN
ncbi:efflux RND transporter permease subunit [Oenococcus sicerae]|nr:hydrophobe/amphiphile efflux-3 (HAE3) family transporter [Oenococcus sicerae]